MFNTVLVAPSTGRLTEDSRFDLGFIAEAMLFYEHVRIVANYGGLDDLIKRIGPELLLEALSEGLLEVTYTPDALGVLTEQSGSPQARHRPSTFTIDRFDLDVAARSILTEATGRSGRGRRLASRLVRLLPAPMPMADAVEQAAGDFANAAYVEEAVRRYLLAVAPGSFDPNTLTFQIADVGDGFWKVESNVDWRLASELMLGRAGEVVLSEAHLLSELLSTRGTIYQSAVYAAELAVGEIQADLIRAKTEDLLRPRDLSAGQLMRFQEMVLGDGFALAEAVNSGRRSFSEAVELAKAARRFRRWTNEQDPSAELLGAYVEEVTAKTWAGRLPARGFRWSLFTAVGMGVGLVGGAAGILTSVGLSAADAFLVERLLRGWRPDQFVNDELRPFTGGSS